MIMQVKLTLEWCVKADMLEGISKALLRHL